MYDVKAREEQINDQLKDDFRNSRIRDTSLERKSDQVYTFSDTYGFSDQNCGVGTKQRLPPTIPEHGYLKLLNRHFHIYKKKKNV